VQIENGVADLGGTGAHIHFPGPVGLTE